MSGKDIYFFLTAVSNIFTRHFTLRCEKGYKMGMVCLGPNL